MIPNLIVAWAALASAQPQGGCTQQALVDSIGSGSLGGLGTPALSSSGLPLIGDPFSLQLAQALPQSSGLVLLGLSAGSLFLPAYAATLYPAGALVTWPFQTAGAGQHTSVLALASLAPALCGLEFTVQAVVIDPAALGQVAFSQGLQLRPGIDAGQPGCSTPGWESEFGTQPGAEGEEVNALLVVPDDGTGSGDKRLIAAGNFYSIGGIEAQRVALFDGEGWSPLGQGTFFSGECLAWFDDQSGGGPTLYLGGKGSSSSVGPKSLQRFQGGAFESVVGLPLGKVSTLLPADLGDGSTLFIGGEFGLYRLVGQQISEVGGGVAGAVLTATLFDAGQGPTLIVGGSFAEAGGTAALRVARWDGDAWSALGSGVGNSDFDEVTGLAAFDSGNGPALYAAGLFGFAGGASTPGFARWNGNTWQALPGLLGMQVDHLTVLDLGFGPALYGGAHSGTSARLGSFDGQSWSAFAGSLAAGTSALIKGMAAFDFGMGDGVLVAGRFDTVADQLAQHLALLDDNTLKPVSAGLEAPVNVLGAWPENPMGAAGLVAGMTWTPLLDKPLQVAQWDGTNWTNLGGQVMSGDAGVVEALASFDDGGGSGLALYAGGLFHSLGDTDSLDSLARWDGQDWNSVGGGVGGNVFSLEVFDAGQAAGPALYVGGRFTLVGGGFPANHIARWDGQNWSALGLGMGSLMANRVQALETYDDGTGPALFAAGEFDTVGGIGARRIAKWDGAQWSALVGPLGEGLDAEVLDLAVHDAGSGQKLIVGGRFSEAGGLTAYGVASWDGSIWSSMGAGFGQASCHSLLSWIDSSGPVLFAGTNKAPGHLKRFDGAGWSNVSSAFVFNTPPAQIKDLLLLDRGFGPELLACGNFNLSDAGDSFVAKWGCQ